MKPTMVRMFRATQSIIIEILSQRCGRNRRMIRIPMASFGSAILRKAQTSVKMTQKAAAGMVWGSLTGAICLIELSAFWKVTALIMSSTYGTNQSAPCLVVCRSDTRSWQKAHPGDRNNEVIPAKDVFLQAHLGEDSYAKESRRHSGERSCCSTGLVCASDQSSLISHSW